MNTQESIIKATLDAIANINSEVNKYAIPRATEEITRNASRAVTWYATGDAIMSAARTATYNATCNIVMGATRAATRHNSILSDANAEVLGRIKL